MTVVIVFIEMTAHRNNFSCRHVHIHNLKLWFLIHTRVQNIILDSLSNWLKYMDLTSLDNSWNKGSFQNLLLCSPCFLLWIISIDAADDESSEGEEGKSAAVMLQIIINSQSSLSPFHHLFSCNPSSYHVWPQHWNIPASISLFGGVTAAFMPATAVFPSTLQGIIELWAEKSWWSILDVTAEVSVHGYILMCSSLNHGFTNLWSWFL